jgi:chromosome segregation ATPase
MPPKLDEVRKMMTALENKVRDTDTKNDALDRKNKEMQSKIQQLEMDLYHANIQKEEEKQQLRNELNLGLVHELEQQLMEKQAELNRSQQQVTMLNQKIGRMEIDFSERLEMMGVQENAAVFREDTDIALEENKLLKEDIDNKEEEIQTLKNGIETSQQTFIQALNELAEENKRLREELDDNKRQQPTTNNNKKKNNQKTKAMMEEEFVQKIADKERALAELEEQICRKDVLLAEMNVIVNKQQSEIEEARKKQVLENNIDDKMLHTELTRKLQEKEEIIMSFQQSRYVKHLESRLKIVETELELSKNSS